MPGITAFGAYVPRLRLSRRAIAEAHQWSKGGGGNPPGGERSVCNWDEDSLTMAVEAARCCLQQRRPISAIYLGSTTLPFADRQNAGIVAAALDLGESLGSFDIGGSQRAGTGALIAAMNNGQTNGHDAELLVVATEHREARAGSPQEMRFGAGAAAFTVGNENPIAELLASETVTVDFVDHFRAPSEEYDYFWEERWIRDEGVFKIVPRAIEKALSAAGVDKEVVSHLVLPAPVPGVRPKLAERLGFPEGALAPSFDRDMGDAGTAHPLLMLTGVLANAEPGQVIVVVSFGQGCDVLVLRTTDAVKKRGAGAGLAGVLARSRPPMDYGKYLSFNGLLKRDLGMRAEGDNKTALTQLYRRRDLLFGLVGGECTTCGTRQIPRSRVCINPNCTSFDTQEPYRFADVPAKIVTWSADHLGFTPDPPAYYGLIEFDGGGRIFANFTEVDPGSAEVGRGVHMAFRVKEYDRKRNFRRYFWKAVPAVGDANETGRA